MMEATMQALDLATQIGFRTRNLSMDEYRELSEGERSYYHALAREENNGWIENQLREYDAGWLVVVDGRVISYGKNLNDYPDGAELKRICEKTRVFPFVFVNDLLLAVEEGTPVWHQTVHPDDHYPTLGLRLQSLDAAKTIDLVADFDTGALGTFVDLDRLISGSIIQTTLFDVPHIATHLSHRYSYILTRTSRNQTGNHSPLRALRALREKIRKNSASFAFSAVNLLAQCTRILSVRY